MKAGQQLSNSVCTTEKVLHSESLHAVYLAIENLEPILEQVQDDYFTHIQETYRQH